MTLGTGRLPWCIFKKKKQSLLYFKTMNKTFKFLTLEGQFDPKRVDAIFYSFRSPSSASLFTMKHFLEIDNEVILLSNSWMW
jgi:hypothetical protein